MSFAYPGAADRPVLRDLDLHVPAGATVDKSFTPEHWGVVEMLLRDPDGRGVSIQAPLPDGVEAPAGHG